jgi:CRISPR/Cas system endoribonuclease Cas6 (RAMP superfamily)
LDRIRHFWTLISLTSPDLKGQTKVSRKGLHYFSSKVTLVFACSDKVFLEYFVTRLFEQKEIIVGNLHLVPESTEAEEPVQIGDEARFLMHFTRCSDPGLIQRREK